MPFFMQASGFSGPYATGADFDPVQIRINYTDASSGIAHSDSGQIIGKIG